MYQLTNYGGSGLQVVTPDPPDAGGAAMNANFKALATQIATSDPGADDDSTAGFGVGSRWYNSATTVEWICLSAAPGDAEWAAVASGLAEYLPLTGGTMSGPLSMAGNAVNMNTGGGTLYMDGGNITAVNQIDGGGSNFSLGDGGGFVLLNQTIWMQGRDIDMNTGGGTGGGDLNLDDGTLNFGNGASLNGQTDGNILVSTGFDIVGNTDIQDTLTFTFLGCTAWMQGNSDGNIFCSSGFDVNQNINLGSTNSVISFVSGGSFSNLTGAGILVTGQLAFSLGGWITGSSDGNVLLPGIDLSSDGSASINFPSGGSLTDFSGGAILVGGYGGFQFEVGSGGIYPVSAGGIQVGGVFFPEQAPTASAPPYVKGGMYFDTTLNKLRIGGASGWETVVSA